MKRIILPLLMCALPLVCLSETVILKPHKDNNDDGRNKDKGKRLPLRPLTCDADVEQGIITFFVTADGNSVSNAEINSADGFSYPLMVVPTADGTIIADLPVLDSGVYEICLTVNGARYSGTLEI